MIIQDQTPNRGSAKAKNPWHGFGHAQKPQTGARLPHGNLFHVGQALTTPNTPSASMAFAIQLFDRRIPLYHEGFISQYTNFFHKIKYLIP